MPPTTASITSTATSASTAVNATTSEADGTGYPRIGFAHNEPPPLVFEVVEPLDRHLSLGLRVHLDEAEAFSSARVTVRDHLGAPDGAER